VRRALAPAAIAAALAVAGAAAGATDPIFGRWLVENGEAVIEIAPCGGAACGRVVWLESPWAPDGKPKRDVENPDRSARDRPLCGLPLISGLKPAGDGAWQDGEIYSARDGRTYGFEIRPDGPNRLDVRGYIGISLLGGSQTWVRENGLRGSCTTIGGPGINR
jgi:uncharacterized protein (DUF2147 family)